MLTRKTQTPTSKIGIGWFTPMSSRLPACAQPLCKGQGRPLSNQSHRWREQASEMCSARPGSNLAVTSRKDARLKSAPSLRPICRAPAFRRPHRLLHIGQRKHVTFVAYRYAIVAQPRVGWRDQVLFGIHRRLFFCCTERTHDVMFNSLIIVFR